MKNESPITKIIIQAGGKGTRLEGLTRNKPKCLVPVNNLPIIFYTFKQFKDAEFTIITDYKTEVLEKYLKTFATEYKYKIIKAQKKGTISGIKKAINTYSDNEMFMIIWCDLILGKNLPPVRGGGIMSEFQGALNADGLIKMKNL